MSSKAAADGIGCVLTKSDTDQQHPCYKVSLGNQPVDSWEREKNTQIVSNLVHEMSKVSCKCTDSSLPGLGLEPYDQYEGASARGRDRWKNHLSLIMAWPPFLPMQACIDLKGPHFPSPIEPMWTLQQQSTYMCQGFEGCLLWKGERRRETNNLSLSQLSCQFAWWRTATFSALHVPSVPDVIGGLQM